LFASVVLAAKKAKTAAAFLRDWVICFSGFGVWGIFLLVFEPLRRLSRSPSVERLPKQSQLKETKAKAKAEA